MKRRGSRNRTRHQHKSWAGGKSGPIRYGGSDSYLIVTTAHRRQWKGRGW